MPNYKREPEVPAISVRWDVQDVMRAFPDLDYHEAVEVLHRTSKYWKPREIGLLRKLAIEAKAHDGEPRKTDISDWPIPGKFPPGMDGPRTDD